MLRRKARLAELLTIQGRERERERERERDRRQTETERDTYRFSLPSAIDHLSLALGPASPSARLDRKHKVPKKIITLSAHTFSFSSLKIISGTMRRREDLRGLHT
jgi:hypothetical protein